MWRTERSRIWPLPEVACSKHHDVPGFCSTHCRNGNRPVERHQATAVLHRDGKKIGIGDLVRTQQASVVEYRLIRDGNAIGPKIMTGLADARPQRCRGVCDRSMPRITRLGHNPHEAILGQRAGRPTTICVSGPPGTNARVKHMVSVENGQQSVDIEEGSHVTGSATTKRLLCQLLLSAGRSTPSLRGPLGTEAPGFRRRFPVR
jgi:hypothetical protein